LVLRSRRGALGIARGTWRTDTSTVAQHRAARVHVRIGGGAAAPRPMYAVHSLWRSRAMPDARVTSNVAQHRATRVYRAHRRWYALHRPMRKHAAMMARRAAAVYTHTSTTAQRASSKKVRAALDRLYG